MHAISYPHDEPAYTTYYEAIPAGGGYELIREFENQADAEMSADMCWVETGYLPMVVSCECGHAGEIVPASAVTKNLGPAPTDDIPF